MAALEARDSYTGHHVRDVVDLAIRVATRLGLREDEIQQTECVALLHDIGKVAIPDTVLHKAGPLDAAEWALLRRHTIVGAEIVSGTGSLAHLRAAVRATHERSARPGTRTG